MFDIGFTEILLISIVALLVLGPERLPQAVRTAALWLGRFRRSFHKIKSEIEQQLNTDEIRRQLHNESILKDLEEAKKKANDALKETEQSITALGDEVQQSIDADKAAKAEHPALEQDETAGAEPGTAADATDEAETSSDDPAPAATEATQKPAHDFYNNPPEGQVSLKGGQFDVVKPADPDTKAADGNDKQGAKHD